MLRYINNNDIDESYIEKKELELIFLVQLKNQEYRFLNLTNTLVHKLSTMLKVEL